MRNLWASSMTITRGLGLPPLAALGLLLKLHIPLVDAARQQVADQDVGVQVPAVSSEFQHHVLAPLQVLDDGGRCIVPVACFQEREALQPCKAVVEGAQCGPVNPQFVGQVANFRALPAQKFLHPFPAKALLQVEGSGGGYVRQVQVLLQKLHVLRLDFTVADVHHFVR